MYFLIVKQLFYVIHFLPACFMNHTVAFIKQNTNAFFGYNSRKNVLNPFVFGTIFQFCSKKTENYSARLFEKNKKALRIKRFFICNM